MSDSLPCYRWKLTRLPHPWDSPRRNTGMGCHFLLQCRKVKTESEVAQSCLTLHDPTDCSLPGSSVHGIFQARGLERVVIASPLCTLFTAKVLNLLSVILLPFLHLLFATSLHPSEDPFPQHSAPSVHITPMSFMDSNPIFTSSLNS